ncbi:TauD/TfdA dioxygenase family protein [Rhodococcus sp. NPDC019627]|uniref:TauD/TfdA dioxygenase family protein n=1 Tax=unclassified Rhodococcus (in: high G+C Gram-positive bacteria) TaxID=192944 RepID=UPI0033E7F046
MFAEVERALLEWKVLFFRNQHITREQHRHFAARLGEIEIHPFFRHAEPGQTAADVNTLARDTNNAGFENNWHNDVTFFETPSRAAILRAIEVPPIGGDTLWADMGAAYDALTDEVKERLDTLRAEHDWIHTFGRYMQDDVREAFRVDYPPVEHPVIRVVPETGRRVLFVNALFTTRIVGLSDQESNDLLDGLYRHIQRPEFQVRLRWQPDTIALWDNRSCQHYATSDYFPARRVMERISVVGERPIGASS